MWRAKTAAKSRLDITVTPFEPPSAATRSAIEDEAQRIATARGARNVAVRYDD